MSLLGFDAAGRLALGQLPTIGLTNTVIMGAPGAFTVSGPGATFKLLQFNAVGTFAIVGAPATTNPKMGSGVASYAVAGQAAALFARLDGSVGADAISGSDALFRSRIGTGVGAFTIGTVGAALKIALQSVPGEYVVDGHSAGFSRDFINWVPYPDGSPPWTGVGASAPSTWSPVAAPASNWAIDPDQQIPPPVRD
ncbi:hypothetical protein [Bradyrhizobium sp. Ce-3]|uniref:hypothetical protein n=1 Tax=Bradyrhizobium sp. Ce-3 TaxID=2913970 RepID=UPI001FC7BE49|nr:hypothetical protein [Bradyrhizobium sp. Ce-3]GKQ52871.1 hypothetical protein BRSPCE3_37260 [Bradyrhizobium sp. Ce-3]